MVQQKAPYGTWCSKITAEAITKDSVGFADTLVDPVTSIIYHIESRPSDALPGRNVLVHTATGKDVVGPGWNVRTAVHEYGGAAAIAYDGVVYFSHLTDGRVYRVSEGTQPEAVTPKAIKDDKPVHRFADFTVHPVHTHLVVSILEDHTNDTPSTVINTLVVINTITKTVQDHPLVAGADFYAGPKFSPDGKRLVWKQWSHPDMPWDGSQIHVADVVTDAKELSIKNDIIIAGKPAKISAEFPSWASNDTLVFTSDVSGYINPWKYTIGETAPLLPTPFAEEFGEPLWQLNFFPYAIIGPTGNLGLFTTIKDGRSGLYLVDLDKKSAPQPIPTPYVTMSYLRCASRQNNEVVFVGQKVDEEASIVKCSLAELTGSFVPMFTVLKQNPPAPFPPGIISIPEQKQVPGATAGPIYAIYYPPNNPDYAGSSIPGELPPCVVNVHGGPTGISYQSLNWKMQYYISRGWGWLDVNSSGSSGYGRKYIERLDSNWGILDSDDCITAAAWLSNASNNLIDPKRIVIRGGSSGGYTSLAAISFGRDLKAFAASTSSYGISSLIPLAEHTHKFESHYMIKLLGGTQQEVPEVYKNRSPINHADSIRAPLLLLQGADDQVVPKEQSDKIYHAILERGGIVEYKVYEGEGHGWRKAETIQDAIKREINFYKTVLKIGQ